MDGPHFTGLAALVSAAALLLHALRAALPALVRAFEARAESGRLDAQTRAAIEAARAAADEATRAALKRCDDDRAELHAEMARRSDEHARELGHLRGMLAVLRAELDDVRRSITAGHSRATD
jgi:hypothetical protein